MWLSLCKNKASWKKAPGALCSFDLLLLLTLWQLVLSDEADRSWPTSNHSATLSRKCQYDPRSSESVEKTLSLYDQLCDERRQFCRTRHFAPVGMLKNVNLSRRIDHRIPAFASLLTEGIVHACATSRIKAKDRTGQPTWAGC